MRQSTFCNVPLSAFRDTPTPRELGAIVAAMPFEAQAKFLGDWAQALKDTDSGRGQAYQLNRIAEAARAWDEELGDGYVAGFVGDLSAAIGDAMIGEMV